MKIFGIVEFSKSYAEGLFGQAWAFLNMDVTLDLKVASVSAKLWALAVAGAAFVFWSSLIGLFGALVG